MSIHKIIIQPICHSIPEVIEFLSDKRSGVEAFPNSLRIGINYTIILNSACYIEGALEAGLKALLRQRRMLYNRIDIPDFYTRKTLNTFYSRIEAELDARASRSTGLSNYDDLFEMILGDRISKFKLIKPVWESVMALFHFRNVIAHGREISAHLVKGWWTNGLWEEEFSGGYRKAEDYLLKKKLIRKRFIEGSESEYFTDKVADHFWANAKEFIKMLSESLSDEEKTVFDSAIWPDESQGNNSSSHNEGKPQHL